MRCPEQSRAVVFPDDLGQMMTILDDLAELTGMRCVIAGAIVAVIVIWLMLLHHLTQQGVFVWIATIES